MYCPDFKNGYALKNDLYADVSSWMRLALHECDQTKRMCVTKAERDQYFLDNIIDLQVKVIEPMLTDYKQTLPLVKSFKGFFYSVRSETNLIKGHEIFVKQNTMELSDE